MSLSRTLVAAAAAATLTAAPLRAYPIDCAILLCLAGGWPAAAECAAAKAEMIRRITPWPIEPPLQLWRCPMQAAVPNPAAPSARLYRVAEGSFPADAGIAGSGRDEPAFGFLRALRVYHIRFHERWRDGSGSCQSTDTSRLGLYDAAGGFHWRSLDARSLPPWAPRPNGCASRRPWHVGQAVAVSWQAYDGTPGHEIVPY